MDREYAERLKEIMKLIVEGAATSTILGKAREIKIELTMASSELQRTLSLLDGMINAYAPDKDWPQGFWTPVPTTQGMATVTVRRMHVVPAASLVTRPERVVEVAKGAMVEGETCVSTKAVADRL
ncbi:MAG: hypothetical protein Q7R39_20455, partial [Dehalococcoidia bacterium]|nr:hypothetical protein [Dehalococcoidia bacterium]